MSTDIDPVPEEAFSGRFLLGGKRLREVAARGTIVNAVFLIGLTGIGFIRGFVIAGFLTTADYGLWGVLVIALGTLLWLKQVGIGDKYIQQDESDQELAFQKAFTLEAMFTGIFMVLMAAAVPLIALVYGRNDLLLPGFFMILIMPAGVLQAPLWIYYRQMKFARQRTLQAIDPLVGFVVAVALAAAGAGYWAIIGGVFAGVWASAIVAVRSSPYPLRFRYEPGTLRSYVDFSWPLFVVGFSGLVIAQVSILLGASHLGFAAAGAITLAATVSQFADRVDGIVSGTLYPAICAVADRTELLFESFVKSNRLALMWALPFGIGLSLFASDLVHFGIGDKWAPAIPVLQIFGLAAAAGQLGFNWDSYFRARGETKPLAAAAVITMFAFLGSAVPLLYTNGLKGFAVGIAIQGFVNLCCRAYFLRRLFRGFGMARHALRAVAPSVPAAVAILVVRAFETGHRSGALAVGELALYLAITIAATLFFERDLLAEATGYLRTGREPSPA